MVKNVFKQFVLCALIGLFVFTNGGCGGGGGSSSPSKELQGQFIDGPVKGLSYECTPSGRKGATEDKGIFRYHSGDEVEFFVGDISLGKVNAQRIVTPLDYFPGYSYDSSEVLELVRLILSAAVVHPDGTVVVDGAPFPGHKGYWRALWKDLFDLGFITVNESDAKDHFKDSLLRHVFSGKYSGTFTDVGGLDDSGTWEATIDDLGKVIATYRGRKHPGIIYSAWGNVTPDGDMELDARGGTGTMHKWTGRITVQGEDIIIKGTWRQPLFPRSHGTFEGKKKD